MTTRHCIWCNRDLEPMSVAPCPCGVVAKEIDRNARGRIDIADRDHDARRGRAYDREQQLNDNGGQD